MEDGRNLPATSPPSLASSEQSLGQFFPSHCRQQTALGRNHPSRLQALRRSKWGRPLRHDQFRWQIQTLVVRRRRGWWRRGGEGRRDESVVLGERFDEFLPESNSRGFGFFRRWIRCRSRLWKIFDLMDNGSEWIEGLKRTRYLLFYNFRGHGRSFSLATEFDIIPSNQHELIRQF